MNIPIQYKIFKSQKQEIYQQVGQCGKYLNQTNGARNTHNPGTNQFYKANFKILNP